MSRLNPKDKKYAKDVYFADGTLPFGSDYCDTCEYEIGDYCMQITHTNQMTHLYKLGRFNYAEKPFVKDVVIQAMIPNVAPNPKYDTRQICTLHGEEEALQKAGGHWGAHRDLFECGRCGYPMICMVERKLHYEGRCGQFGIVICVPSEPAWLRKHHKVFIENRANDTQKRYFWMKGVEELFESFRDYDFS